MADQKVSALTDAGTLDGDEYLYVVDDPSGTAVSRRTTFAAGVASAFSGASVYRATTNQSFSSGTATPIEFNAEAFDTDDYHDNATNNTRLTVPSAGKYRLSGTVTISDLSSGGTDSQVRLHVNGSFVRLNYRYPTDASSVTTPISGLLDLSASDYVEVAVYHAAATPEVRFGSQWTAVDIQKVG